MIKCRNIIFELLERAEAEAGCLERNESKAEWLGSYCDAVDEVAKAFFAEDMRAFIGEDGSVHIFLECEEFVVKDPNHVFYLTVLCANAFEISASDTGLLMLSYVISGIWE